MGDIELFTTVGSSEALLKLLAVYQGTNGYRPNPFAIWSKIAAYVRAGGEYRFYPLSECKSEDPGGRFRDDLGELIGYGFLRPLDNGDIEVTPEGQSWVSTLALPKSLTDLGTQIAIHDSE